MFNKQRLHAGNIELILTPSWLSGVGVAVVTLVLVIGSIFILHYQGSNLQFLVQTQQADQQSVSDNYITIDEDVSSNSFLSNLPLFVFWGGVGLIAYAFTMSLADTFRNVERLEKQMHYVHANPKQLRRRAFERLGIRLVALLVWWLYATVSVKVILPYVVALADAGSGAEVPYVNVALYLLLAIAVTALSLHVHVILARLVALRPRIFGGVLDA